MKSLGFDSVVWGGTGWNMIWSFGVLQFFIDAGLKSPQKIGVVSGGCMPALAWIGAADHQIGIVQTEHLYKFGDIYFNDRFRRRFRRYFESFANKDCMETLKDYDFYSTYTKIPSFELVKDNKHESRKEFLDKLLAGCHIPFLLGVNVPLFHNGSYIIDVINYKKTWWTFPGNSTLVISPNEKSTHNIIGGEMNLLSTIGIRGKLTSKDIFLKGYTAAADWYANIKYENTQRSKENWRNKSV